MASSVFKAGHTALITGGASGIGLALAKKCTTHGMKVLVADWDDELLRALPQNISTNNNTGKEDLLSTIKMDVSNPDDWARLKKKADDTFPDGHVNLLALNAGIGPSSSWSDPASFDKILAVNLHGVIHGITTFLETVKATATATSSTTTSSTGGGRAAIVITGSKQGITNPPGNPAYNASKAAVKSLAEHLSYDLRAEAGPGAGRLSVHLLVPGWTFTGLSGNRPGAGKEKPQGAWWPEQVVDFAEKKIDEGQFWILCPDDQVTEQLVSTLLLLFGFVFVFGRIMIMGQIFMLADIHSQDRKRMLWGASDAIEGRPPLTRWRDEWKQKHQDWLDKQE